MSNLASLVRTGHLRKSDFNTLKMFRSGKVHVSDSFKNKYKLGIENGIDFAFVTVEEKVNDLTLEVFIPELNKKVFRQLVMVIVPREVKPLPSLFASKKQLQSIKFIKASDSDVITRTTEPKLEINGIQTDKVLVNNTLLEFIPDAQSAHLEIEEELEMKEVDIFTTSKNERLILRKNPVTVFSIKFTNIIIKQEKS